MARDVFGFAIAPNMRRLMSLNGLHGAIMRADKIKSDTNQLPPGIPIPVLPVDYLKERPNFWIGGIGSYVCPVESDWALWFNWSMNKVSSTAILCSVKGMNPMTGQRISGFDLMNFQEKCPIHNEEFKHGLFCSKCNFKWPYQNYYSAPNQLFCDGFRLPDGTERQFYFTEDMAKSIPEQVIGKDDTVPAFGFCFYETKERQKYEDSVFLKNKFPKEEQQLFIRGSTGFTGVSGESGLGGFSGPIPYTTTSRRFDALKHTVTSKDFKFLNDLSPELKKGETSEGHLVAEPMAAEVYLNCSSNERFSAMNSSESLEVPASETLEMHAMNTSVNFVNEDSSLKFRNPSAEVGIGAGNKIEKKTQKSSHSLDEWKEKPSSVIRVYFVFREQFERYIESGFNNLEGVKEGYLEGVSK